MSHPLRIAVVGHTNTGKTSLMRTLLRDTEFGEVSDRPAVTREVEGAPLLAQGRVAAELYDTPGLEDSIALLDHLEKLRGDRRTEGVDVIDQFLKSPAAEGHFSQEAKALRQVLQSDVALYVIDARDRVLGKHRDELTVLAMCARPVVPVLNFTAPGNVMGAGVAGWREQLARCGLHAVAEFDTVVLADQGEQRLFETMRTLLPGHRQAIDALIEDRQQQRDRLITAASNAIADLLLDASAYCVSVPHGDTAQMREATDNLKSLVRGREQQCVEQLLELFRFHRDEYTADDLPLTDGQWGLDLFSPAALKQFGIRAGGGAAAGAVAGLAVDAMVGGLALGTATAAGAAIGALLGTGRTHGRRLLDRLKGRTELRCDDATIRLLEARQVALTRALLRRGHAAQQPVEVKQDSSLRRSRLPEAIQQARLTPSWSRLGESVALSGLAEAARERAQSSLAETIQQSIKQSGTGQ
ncbi:MAG TPA: GTPase/DUF3482 domain-containing protein [Phycisphaerales bacterium]|nr:GTPase/DUF3482 domain-containing protein [Phycisphaerales bacterium]HRQ76545.1 GTPase/DUF3482 domain-containing protein [Phycisphaerales bacterium]